MVFLIGAAKFFVINMLKMFDTNYYNHNSEANFSEYLRSKFLLSNMTYIFSLLVIGNLIDNCNDHR
jgi:hypothetical protein